jgi:hypothetical protein
MLFSSNTYLGHGEVGFSLAKNLVNAKHAVTILQDSSADMNAQPFCEYSKVCSIASMTLNASWLCITCDTTTSASLLLNTRRRFDQISSLCHDILVDRGFQFCIAFISFENFCRPPFVAPKSNKFQFLFFSFYVVRGRYYRQQKVERDLPAHRIPWKRTQVRCRHR